MGRKVFIVGSGAVGTSLGKALKNAGREITGIYDINSIAAKNASEILGVQGYGGALPDIIKNVDTVLVTVPDHIISQIVSLALAEELFSSSQIWIHCSGHLTTSVFEPLKDKIKGMATMHPAFVFPPKKCTHIPEGVFFAVGGDKEGLQKALDHVNLLKGIFMSVDPEKRPLYHAAMVMGSNYLVTLLSAARDTLIEAGISEKQIEPLLYSLSTSAIDRTKKLGISHSLSGPVRRGDVSVVKDHLEALKPFKKLQELYIEMGRATVDIAEEQDGYCKDTALTLKELLKKY
ncbi:MAG: DUF2520 domain-containing protein [Deltaproteobacteria bacterium]|nr:DUF2520 domain-containing protein [Deltaproteobacteria bacterium]